MTTTSLKGKRALVTGATAGIGLETARGLAAMGADVVLVGRNAQKAQVVADELRRGTGANVDVLVGDLSLMSDVRKVAAEAIARFKRLDILVNNAGGLGNTRVVTAEGFEATFALNHLSYFLLTNLLLPLLKQSAPARVVSVASDAHKRATLDFDDLQCERGYTTWKQYGRTKLCNVLFTRELAKRLAGTNVTANSLHPGVVASNFFKQPGFMGALMKLGSMLMITPEEGAKTSLYLASSPEVATVTGLYFDKCKPVSPSKAAVDDAAAARLWDISEKLTGLR